MTVRRTDVLPLCDAWAGKDARVRVIHKPNGGLSDARNAGLTVASGEEIAFVDSDDWVDPDMLERLHNQMEETGADLAACGVTWEYPGGHSGGPPSSGGPALYSRQGSHAGVYSDLHGADHGVEQTLSPGGSG